MPIAPKPVATVILAPSTTLPSASAATSAATPTYYQLSALRNHETESRTGLSNLSSLDLSSSLINVAQAASTPASQNSGNMVTQTPLLSRAMGTISPFPRVNLLEKSTLQGPSSSSFEAATRPEGQSSGNTLAQSQLSASPIVIQNASSTAIHDAVGTNSQPEPSQRINSLVDMVPQGQLLTSATVSQTTSALSVDSSFNMRSQRQIATLATNSLPPTSQRFFSSVDMVPQRQFLTSDTVCQNASVTSVDGSVNMLSQRQILTPHANFPPSQAFNCSIGMVPPGQLPAPATNSHAASTLPVNGFSNTLSEEQVPVLATTSVTLPIQSWYNSINMLPQGHLATSAIGSQSVSRPVQPLVSGNITPENQILRSAGVSEESFEQYSVNTIPQLVTQSSYTSFNTGQEHEAAETSCEVANESIRELHRPSVVSSAMVPHPSGSTAQSPGLNLLAKVGEAQRELYEQSFGNGEIIQVAM